MSPPESCRRAAVRMLALVVLLTGCEQNMYEQPKLKPYGAAPFFPGGLAALAPPHGTVPRTADPEPRSETLPLQLTDALLARGRERYDIFCSPCHGRVGNGEGIIVQRGFPAPPSYHTDRLRRAPDRHFYAVISDGFGRMYSYASRVPIPDRWAIVAFIRALQLSQHATADDLRAARVLRERETGDGS